MWRVGGAGGVTLLRAVAVAGADGGGRGERGRVRGRLWQVGGGVFTAEGAVHDAVCDAVCECLRV